MAEAFPLAWPEGWARTPATTRRAAPYRTNAFAAKENLLHELKLLGAYNVVISTNSPLKSTGLPYASEVSDPGVAVYWSTKQFKERCIACDKWFKIYDNVHSIGKAIGALRSLQRVGASQIMDRAFTAFGALPQSSSAPVVRPWWEVLEIPEAAISALSMAMVQARFRELTTKNHPDRGGNQAHMVELNRAFTQAQEHYGNR